MKTNFSGGEVRTGSAVWNTGPAMPVPEPREYTLRVELPNLAGWMEAKAATPEALIAFETQTRALDYEWISLDRTKPAKPEGGTIEGLGPIGKQLKDAGAFDTGADG
jgi:hypothetical protein